LICDACLKGVITFDNSRSRKKELTSAPSRDGTGVEIYHLTKGEVMAAQITTASLCQIGDGFFPCFFVEQLCLTMSGLKASYGGGKDPVIIRLPTIIANGRGDKSPPPLGW